MLDAHAIQVISQLKVIKFYCSPKLCSGWCGFFVQYDNGQSAEVSWSFIRELPPKNSKK